MNPTDGLINLSRRLVRAFDDSLVDGTFGFSLVGSKFSGLLIINIQLFHARHFYDKEMYICN